MKFKSRSKALLLLILISIIGVITMSFFKQQPKAHAENVTYTDSTRYYKILIPERYGNAFFNIVSGNENQISVADYKALLGIINNQLIPQSQTFFIQDSIAKSKIKKPVTDSTLNKK